jgi:flagellar basal-body rod protein FlgB
MIGKLLFGTRTMDLLKGGMDAATARMRVSSENLANVTTPGYAAQRVEFEEHIAQARQTIELEQSQPGHQGVGRPGAAPEPRVKRSPEQVQAGAINNVDMEAELVRLKQNELHYQALTQMIASKYKGIQDALR